MIEGEASDPSRGQAGRVLPFPQPGANQQVAFDRRELQAILNLYGRMVSQGEWRDYAIDFARDRAVFSIYRRTSETPFFRIVKDPKLARRQGAYAVVNSAGMVLKRGHDLVRVLRVLEPLRVVTD